jgi:hypothetical protein
MSYDYDVIVLGAPLRAPVLIVTPDGFGLGGKQPRDGTLRPITPSLAGTLAHGLPLAKRPTAPRSPHGHGRRPAPRGAGGHPLPKRIPPAEHNLNGILGSAAASDTGTLGPWLIAALAFGTVLLGALLVAVHRRVVGRDAPQTADSRRCISGSRRAGGGAGAASPPAAGDRRPGARRVPRARRRR